MEETEELKKTVKFLEKTKEGEYCEIDPEYMTIERKDLLVEAEDEQYFYSLS